MPTANRRINLSISPDLEQEIAEYMKETETFMWSRAICALLKDGLNAYKEENGACTVDAPRMTPQEKKLIDLFASADKPGKEMAVLILKNRAK